MNSEEDKVKTSETLGAQALQESKYYDEPEANAVIDLIKNWGSKKRERYTELVNSLGWDMKRAFRIVEEHKGEIPEGWVKDESGP